jgi:hypothetical protein
MRQKVWFHSLAVLALIRDSKFSPVASKIFPTALSKFLIVCGIGIAGS